MHLFHKWQKKFVATYESFGSKEVGARGYECCVCGKRKAAFSWVYLIGLGNDRGRIEKEVMQWLSQKEGD